MAGKRADLCFDGDLGDARPPWADEFAPMLMTGCPWLNEVVFVHRASRTLVVTDLVFNIVEPKGVVHKLVLWCAGPYRRLAQSRLLRLMTKDKSAFGASVVKLLQCDFDRLVMAHGEVVQTDAKRQLRAAWSFATSKALTPGPVRA